MPHPNIWKPFTIIKGAPEPITVDHGEGVWLTLKDGRRVIDCISSWWVNLHGHSHPEISRAIYEQAQRLEHVIFANFSHEPAENLARRLTKKLPDNLNRVFYSDNGSTAVEVALKVAWQFWKNRQISREKFIAFEGSYHGDTLGAMSAGSRSVFTRVFGDLMFEVEFLPYPETWIGDDSAEEREDQIIGRLEKMLEQNPERYAGVIIEPLVQGAGGMRMCRPAFLKKLEQTIRQTDVLLIYDEVMTGFGRTGDWFAATRSDTQPDIICLAKGITGGFLPLSVTVCSDHIYESFNTEDPVGTLWHGHSYTANPLGCAAALASLDLLEENDHSFKGMEKIHYEELPALAQLETIHKARVTGTIAALTIRSDGKEGYLSGIGKQIKGKCLDYGLLIRPLGDVVYLMPPYCITQEELKSVYSNLGKMIREL